MKFKTNLKHTNHLIDLTPLVDVIFLMLIFFIVTSDILPLKSLNIKNPSLELSSTPLTSQLVVVMDAQNVIYVGSKKTIVDLASLKSHLVKEMTLHENSTVVISMDKSVEYDVFLKLFSIVQECASNIRLVYLEC